MQGGLNPVFDMRIKTHREQIARTMVFVCAFIITALNAFGLGSEYPKDRPVTGAQISSWPTGMLELVDSPSRIYGFWVNSEEIFFFSGMATNFSEFLQAYSQIQGVEKHRLILHDGTGKAKSPWQTPGRSCDWKVYGCPKGWHNLGTLKGTNSVEVIQKAAKEPGYILEVHFWTGGHIALDQVIIPKNVDVKKEERL
jgi:hypothetical protein